MISEQGQLEALATVQTGSTGTQGDKINRTLWDELLIAAAPLQNRLFMNPVSVGGRVMDQTNNTQGGQMPANRQLIVRAIKIFYVSETTAAIKATAQDIQDLYTLLFRTTAVLFINNREFGQWNLNEFMGLSLAVAVNPAVTFTPPFLNPRFHGIMPLNEPVAIAGTMQFNMELTHSVAPTGAVIGDRLRVGLSGIEVRVN